MLAHSRFESRYESHQLTNNDGSQILTSGDGFPVPEGGIDPFGLSGPRCSKRLVMAAQGYCFTWGVELMLTTDVRIAADNTQFGMLEVKRGIYPRFPPCLGIRSTAV